MGLAYLRKWGEYMDSISTALSGIQAAAARLDSAANNIANSNTPGFKAQQPVQNSGESGVQVVFSLSSFASNPQTSNVDMPTQMVELITDKQSVAFDTAVIRTQDAISHSMLDMLA